eukprot:COSAG04_NODE_21765_length_368_cov_0.654275_1_plen_55_part_10
MGGSDQMAEASPIGPTESGWIIVFPSSPPFFACPVALQLSVLASGDQAPILVPPC